MPKATSREEVCSINACTDQRCRLYRCPLEVGEKCRRSGWPRVSTHSAIRGNACSSKPSVAKSTLNWSTDPAAIDVHSLLKWRQATPPCLLVIAETSHLFADEAFSNVRRNSLKPSRKRKPKCRDDERCTTWEVPLLRTISDHTCDE